MRSLQARLVAALTAVILAAGFLSGAWTFRWAFQEAIELQDAILRQVGAIAATTPLSLQPSSLSGVDAEARFVVEELDRSGRRTSATAAVADLPPGLPDGLQTITREGEPWRVLLRTRPDGGRVAVSQPTANRDEVAREAAQRSVVPLAALLPTLALAIAWMVRRTFRPVAALAARLDEDRSDRPLELPRDGMPSELSSFINAINRLLERIGGMVEQQRRFVADAAHELRTPIAALSVQAENLGVVELDERNERLAALQGGIRRTGRLLDQLLALARYDAQAPEAVAPAAFDQVLKQTVADHVLAAEAAGVDLGFKRIEAVAVRVDPTALAVLIRNLLDNALRHTPPGGRIDIDLAAVGERARLRIEDTGPGIPQSELADVLRPFHRGRQATGDGSGLGLAIVRRIAETYGGAISLENLSPNGPSGLRVTVQLPLANASAP